MTKENKRTAPKGSLVVKMRTRGLQERHEEHVTIGEMATVTVEIHANSAMMVEEALQEALAEAMEVVVVARVVVNVTRGVMEIVRAAIRVDFLMMVMPAVVEAEVLVTEVDMVVIWAVEMTMTTMTEAVIADGTTNDDLMTMDVVVPCMKGAAMSPSETLIEAIAAGTEIMDLLVIAAGVSTVEEPETTTIITEAAAAEAVAVVDMAASMTEATTTTVLVAAVVHMTSGIEDPQIVTMLEIIPAIAEEGDMLKEAPTRGTTIDVTKEDIRMALASKNDYAKAKTRKLKGSHCTRELWCTYILWLVTAA